MVSFDPVERFKSLEEVQVWLEEAAHSDADFVTARAALRTVPALIVEDRNAVARHGLLIFRMALFLAVRAMSPRRKFDSEFSGPWLKKASERSILYSAESAVCRSFVAAVSSYGSRALPDSRSGLQTSTLQDSCIAIGYAGRDGHEIFITDRTPAFKQYEIDCIQLENREAASSTPLWGSLILPDSLKREWDALKILLSKSPEFQFWLSFYHGIWNGTFTDWDLALEVTQIPEEDWDKGHEHIGKRIAEIEAHMRPDPLPEVDARRQATKLLAQPEPAALAADGLAQLIEMATLEYKREISNALPDELNPLENLPAILHEISLILTTSRTTSEKEAQLQAALRLAADTVSDLNGRLRRTRLELETCRRDGHGRRLFADAFYERAGERVAELVTSKILWGGLASGTAFILGGGSAEALTTGLQECFQNVIQPEATDAPTKPMKPK